VVSNEPAGNTTISLRMDSPIGPIVVSGNDRVVTRVLLPAEMSKLGALFPPTRGLGPVLAAVHQLDEYFSKRRKAFDLPLQLVGTQFQREVWLALSKIPYGETISYRELAALVGRPRAFRAVGQANRTNPLPIILPCHRVIAADGTIGGYGGGTAIKRQLLALEGATERARGGVGVNVEL
jgi:methylated-DNA-[protein]-cysteine S-methyltransferase